MWDIVLNSLWNHSLSIMVVHHHNVFMAYVSSPLGDMANHRDIIFGIYMHLYVILMHIKN